MSQIVTSSYDGRAGSGSFLPLSKIKFKLKSRIKIWKGLRPLDPVRKMLIIFPSKPPRREAFNRQWSGSTLLLALKKVPAKLALVILHPLKS
jgi:hypothetical protein